MAGAEQFVPPVLEFLDRAGALALRIQATAAKHIKAEDVVDGETVSAAARAFTQIVTEADTAISAMFADFVAALPNAADHYVIDEEVCGTVGAARAAIGRAKHVWVVDPIDGTAPYAHGLPLWGTMVALFEDGAPVFGAISQPALGELVYGGSAVGGVFWQRGGTPAAPLGTVAVQPLHPSAIVMGPTWMADFDPDPVLMMDVHAAAAYALFALTGRVRAAFFGQPMKIWDTAAAMAMAPLVGLGLLNTRLGQPLATLDLDALLDNWKLRDIHVLCHPGQFDELRKLPRNTAA